MDLKSEKRNFIEQLKWWKSFTESAIEAAEKGKKLVICHKSDSEDKSAVYKTLPRSKKMPDDKDLSIDKTLERLEAFLEAPDPDSVS